MNVYQKQHLCSELSWSAVPWTKTLCITLVNCYVILQYRSQRLKSLPGSSVASDSLLLYWRHYNTCWEIFVATKAVAIAIQGRCWQTQSCTVPSLEIKMGHQPQNWTPQDSAALIVKQMLERLQSSFLGKSLLCLDAPGLPSIWSASENIYWIFCHSICIRNLAQRNDTHGRSPQVLQFLFIYWSWSSYSEIILFINYSGWSGRSPFRTLVSWRNWYPYFFPMVRTM